MKTSMLSFRYIQSPGRSCFQVSKEFTGLCICLISSSETHQPILVHTNSIIVFIEPSKLAQYRMPENCYSNPGDHLWNNSSACNEVRVPSGERLVLPSPVSGLYEQHPHWSNIQKEKGNNKFTIIEQEHLPKYTHFESNEFQREEVRT